MRQHSGEHPTTTTPPPTRTLALTPNNIHLISPLNKLIWRQRCDLRRLLDVWSRRNQFALLQSAGMFEQFILKRIVNVLFDDDVLCIALHKTHRY